MRNSLIIILLCCSMAQAQFIKNTGIQVVNSTSIITSGDWTSDAGASTKNDGTITLADAWTNNGSLSGGGGFVLNYATDKSFKSGSPTFGFLKKTGAGAALIGSSIYPVDSLVLVNGLLKMNATDTVWIKNAVVKTSGASYVEGLVAHSGTGDRLFPLGKDGNYLPIKLVKLNASRATASVVNAPTDYTAGAGVESLVAFPYVWRVVKKVAADTAKYVEVGYPASLVTTTNPILARETTGKKYSNMGARAITTANNRTTVLSYLRGLVGRFTIAKGFPGSLRTDSLDVAPVASAATAITTSGFVANWAAVTSATSYQLDVSTDNFATYLVGYNSKEVASTSETVSGLTASTAYKYRVRAFNAAGISINSNTIDVSTKQNQTITFAALAAKTFGDAAFTLSATASSQLAVSYASSNADVATISGNTVTIVGVGTTIITASQAGNNAFEAATNVTQTLIVNKANQTIAFAALLAKSVTDAAFTLATTGGASGLPVTFVSSNTAVATINGSTVTIVGVGTTNITASQAGNANYNAATDVSQTLTVNTKPGQTITFAALAAKTFGDAAFTLTATASSQLAVSFASSNTAVATISGNTVTIVGAGTSIITASQAGDNTFNPASNVTQTLTVNKANQVITFAALPPKLVTDAAFTLAATGGASGQPVTFASSNTAVATVNGNAVTIVGVGSTNITASQAGNDNYNAATAVTQTLTVNAKTSQTITFAALPAKTFGEAAFTLAATASSQLAVSYASSNTAVATISGNTVTIVGAGTSTITASQAGNDTFNPASNVTQTLTVNKANQTITFAALPAKLVGSAAFALTASGGASGLPVTFASSNTSVATISGGTVTIVAAGTTNITASQAGNSNYNAAADVVQVLTVTAKQNQTITFAALADKLITDNPFALTATASSNLPVAYSTTSDKITISGSQVTLVKAGRASIVANQAGNDAFNAATAVTQSFCIKPAKPTITLTNNNTETVTLNSSATSGNQWNLAGTAIAGATNATLAVTAPGVYKVQVKVDDCTSEFSADQTILVTGDLKLDVSSISISPNPVDEVLQLNGIVGEIKSNHLFDMTGRASSPLTLEKKNEFYQASVEHLTQGVYVLRILQDNKVVQVKFVKK